jgi:hypothetical protein
MAVAALVLAGSPLAAQVPWDSPQLVAPGTPRGVSLMYVDYGLRPLDGTGLLLTYRGADAPRGLGVRLAGTLPREDDVRLSGGVDLALPMLRHSAAFPLDVMWTWGLGGGVGDYYSVAVPVGAAASRVFTGSGIEVRPYTSARMALEGYFGANHPEETFGLTVAADVGVDVSLLRSRRVIVRAAMSLGDRRAMAVGLQVAPGRPGLQAAR